MKTRIVSALVGLVILGVVLALFETLLLNAVIGFICIVAVLELFKATGCIKHNQLTVVAMIMTVIIPFVRWARFRPYILEVFFVMVLVFFLLMLNTKAAIGMEQVAMAFFFSTVIPVFFSCAVYIRDDYHSVRGIFYLMLALGAAWLCDSGAYFVGIKFGKHKLAPHISPKKTVEGAVGGIVVGTLLMLALALGYQQVLASMGVAVRINYGLLALCTPVFNVIGMMGDLSASAIKRQYGIKDYGHIMPGHGGILDRFDSVLFTLPTVYILVHHVELIVLL